MDTQNTTFRKSRHDVQVLALDAIDANYNSIMQKKKRVYKNSKKLKTLTILSTAVVFIIGIFSYIVYSQVMDSRENDRRANMSHDAAAQPGAQGTQDGGQEISQPEDPDTLPLAVESRPILPAILSLREKHGNEDIVGYIKIDGTDIDYVVMQSNDNEYYLDRNIQGQVTSAGSVFMDCANNPAELDRHTIIYAHNMRNGTMFHNLRFYQNKQFFDSNRYIHLTTLHDETIWEAFSFFTESTDSDYIQLSFPSDDSFLDLVTLLTEKSMHESDTELGADDLILTLSTFEGGADRDVRYVLNAKLIDRVGAEDF